jgi:hypothetical protein
MTPHVGVSKAFRSASTANIVPVRGRRKTRATARPRERHNVTRLTVARRTVLNIFRHFRSAPASVFRAARTRRHHRRTAQSDSAARAVAIRHRAQ